MTAFTKFTASVAGLAAACTLCLATPAFAAPPHGGPGGPGFGSPGAHPPAPPPRPVPPPHHRHRSWHNNDYAWLWAPIAAGTLVYGVTQSVRTPTYTVVQPAYALPAAPSISNSVTTTTTTTTTKTSSAQKTVYWCEAEQGWWPTVRACPTGWKAMPAP